MATIGHDALRKGRTARRDARLVLTASGAETFRQASNVRRELGIERRHGISDGDDETTIRVLQRTVRNVGSDAWHG